jgi:hypothetical protein
LYLITLYAMFYMFGIDFIVCVFYAFSSPVEYRRVVTWSDLGALSLGVRLPRVIVGSLAASSPRAQTPVCLQRLRVLSRRVPASLTTVAVTHPWSWWIAGGILVPVGAWE